MASQNIICDHSNLATQQILIRILEARSWCKYFFVELVIVNDYGIKWHDAYRASALSPGTLLAVLSRAGFRERSLFAYIIPTCSVFARAACSPPLSGLTDVTTRD